MNKLINPATLARPRGFNHGILAGGGPWLFLAGQDASDSEGRIVAPGDVVGQYEQALHNVRAVVAEAGGAMTDIVSLTLFVKDRADYVAQLKELGAVHRRYFGAYYPAMALLEVTGFFQAETLIEVQGIAVIHSDT
jgi:enamine deaminase RidA (YjgF/YER057c/UK114 family)